MDKKHKGAHNELVATVWLLKHGYEVFRNVSPHGDVDIIALKDGKITLFDVKWAPTVSNGLPSASRLSDSQLEIGVQLLCVYGDNECCIIEDMRPKGGASINCINCGVEFKQRSLRQKFCNNWCRSESGNIERRSNPLIGTA